MTTKEYKEAIAKLEKKWARKLKVFGEEEYQRGWNECMVIKKTKRL